MMFFCKLFKHSQTSSFIWISTTWLLIFQLEVANKKSLFTTKPASIWIEIFCQKRYSFLQLQNFYIPQPRLLHCIGKKLFANMSKTTRNWFLTPQPDNYLQFTKVGTRKGMDEHLTLCNIFVYALIYAYSYLCT